MQLRLEHIGGGQFRPLSKLDYELCVKALEAGEHVRAKITRQRSVRQNDFFHALIEATWENQRGGPQLPTWTHLKHWLLIQAGHCDVTHFDAGAMTPAVAAHLRKLFDTVDFSTDGRRIAMRVAKSVSFKACDSEAMKIVVDRVTEIICSEIVPGVTPEQLFEMARKRAA